MLFIILIVLIALVFDFTNGMHDAANSIATIVSTRVLSPRQAVIWAAFFNFVAFLIFGTGVAETIGKGLIDIDVVTPKVIFAGLLGAIAWNLITWYFGLPSSSSHALIGGYLGAAVAKAGFGVMIMSGWIKIAIFIVLAPLLGMVLGLAPDDRGHLDLPPRAAAARYRPGRASCSWSRRPCTAWGTAATTPRRPWASSPACSSPAG